MGTGRPAGRERAYRRNDAPAPTPRQRSRPATSTYTASPSESSRQAAFNRATPAVAKDADISLMQLDGFLRGQPGAIDRGAMHTLAKRLGLA